MTNVVQLPGHRGYLVPTGVDHDIVRQLEDLLEEAKGGQIAALAFAVYRPGDCITHGWSHGEYAFHLAAAIMALEHAFGALMAGELE